MGYLDKNSSFIYLKNKIILNNNYKNNQNTESKIIFRKNR